MAVAAVPLHPRPSDNARDRTTSPPPVYVVATTDHSVFIYGFVGLLKTLIEDVWKKYLERVVLE